MTPAQRKYDLDLAKSMHDMAVFIAPRSQKVADALNSGADRIEALTVQVVIDDPIPVDSQGRPIIQPASTPAEPQI